MYESYWNLQSKPFENNGDEKFYYPSEAHQGALLKLRYVIDNRGGAALLSGGAGLGKSLLIQSLYRSLPENVAPRLNLVFPCMPPEQLLAYIADELTGESPTADASTMQQSVRRIQHALNENCKADRHVVLAIDEAHMLADYDALTVLRLLMNFETGNEPGLTLLLIGQGSILPAIERIPSLEERLAVKCVLRPFELEETVSYVTHRLTAAGSKEPIFEGQALDAIHEISRGVPRRINRLCDLALLIGYAEERKSIGVEQVDEVSEELITVAPE